MKNFLFFLILALGFSLSAQELSPKLLQSTPLDAEVFYGVDDYGAVYYSKNNALFKKGDKNNYQFTALQLGKISSVDIVNPLKITVFYEMSNTALVLDNTLSEITRINFSAIENFRNVSHATTANDRRFWIFNTDLQQLEIFDWNSRKVVVQSPPLQTNALATTSNFNFCWLVTESGLLMFNNYGSAIDSIDLSKIPTDISLAQANGNVIAFAKSVLSEAKVAETENLKPKVYYKSSSAEDFVPLKLPDLVIKQLSLNGERLYIYDGLKVTSFSLKPPKN
ncbi:hypothetical protein EAX61_13710 [Dokdonia sinensis]|uniref:WD40 repeat domain-containing protein n=1 Tax=Dokdonia sinensis TaxID=2479847 RepID=A0A3M0FXJ2_9FLAO|nr:hypothetical protein [Dokdonia sinensis]RMB56657.1 hypothetical protein EAX61_13710 [Dokdonia sinensis]